MQHVSLRYSDPSLKRSHLWYRSWYTYTSYEYVRYSIGIILRSSNWKPFIPAAWLLTHTPHRYWVYLNILGRRAEDEPLQLLGSRITTERWISCRANPIYRYLPISTCTDLLVSLRLLPYVDKNLHSRVQYIQTILSYCTYLWRSYPPAYSVDKL